MKKEMAILFVICIVLAALMWRKPPTNFDDANYIYFAKQIVNGTFSATSSPYAYGYAYPATIALTFFILGINTFASTLPQMMEYIVLILLIYLIIRKQTNSEKYGFMAGILAATSAFILAYSSRALPDMLIGVLVALALFLYVYAEYMLDYLFIGCIAGLTIFVKLGGLIILPIMLLFIYMDNGFKKGLYTFIGILIILAIYFSTLPLSIITSYSRFQSGLSVTKLPVNIFTAIYWMPIGYTTGWNGFYTQVFPLGGMFLMCIAGSVIAIFKKERKMLFAYGFFWLSYTYLFLGSESITHYQPIVVVSRYFIWLSVPMAILAVYFIMQLEQWLARRYPKITVNLVIYGLIGFSVLSNLPMLLLLRL